MDIVISRLKMTDLFNRMGRSAFSYLSGENAGSEADFVGSIVDVGGIEVQVFAICFLLNLEF